jgi:hypothetical protein
MMIGNELIGISAIIFTYQRLDRIGGEFMIHDEKNESFWHYSTTADW